MKKTARRFGSFDPSPTVVPAVEKPTRIVRDPCAIEVNDDSKGRFTMSNNENPEHELHESRVRRAIDVFEEAVRLCSWDGLESVHAHSAYRLAPGAVVAIGDDVPVEAIRGGFNSWRTYRRVGDECIGGALPGADSFIVFGMAEADVTLVRLSSERSVN
jgi:hypothetical protein